MRVSLKPHHSTRIICAAAILAGGASFSGCSRSGDSVLGFSRPSMPSLSMGSFRDRFRWRRAEAEEPVVDEVDQFPPAPAPVVVQAPEPKKATPVQQAARPSQAAPVQQVAQNRKPRRTVRRAKPVSAADFRAPRLGVKPPFSPAADNSKAVTCVNVSKPGERVKMECK